MSKTNKQANKADKTTIKPKEIKRKRRQENINKCFKNSNSTKKANKQNKVKQNKIRRTKKTK